MKIMFGSFYLIYVFMHGFLFVSTPGNDFLITGVNASVQHSDALRINILLLYTLFSLDLLVVSPPALLAVVYSLNCVFLHF